MMKPFAIGVVALGLAAGSADSSGALVRSGLHGDVRIDPGYPVCGVGSDCTRPAANVWLVFSRHGRIVARVRTLDVGSYRIGLRPGTYVRSPPAKRQLTPHRVIVRRGHVRRVDFSLDIGIR
jgi:hypothetical protein